MWTSWQKTEGLCRNSYTKKKYRKPALSETEPNSRIFTVKTILNEDISKTKLLKNLVLVKHSIIWISTFRILPNSVFCEIRWSKEAETAKIRAMTQSQKVRVYGMVFFVDEMINEINTTRAMSRSCNLTWYHMISCDLMWDHTISHHVSHVRLHDDNYYSILIK